MQVYLPKGAWYDFWTGDAHKGGRKLRVKLKADRIPIFVKAGAVLPTADVTQNTAEMARLQDIELSIFVANTGASKFYWDAGEGYGHEAGQFTERTYTISRKDKKLKLRQSVAGAFNPSFKRAELRFCRAYQPAPQGHRRWQSDYWRALR